MKKTTCINLREGGEPVVICKLENGKLSEDKLIVLALDYKGFERSFQMNSKGLNAFSFDRLRENKLLDVEERALELISGDYEAKDFLTYSGRCPLGVYNNFREYQGLLMFGRKYNPYSLKQVKASYVGALELRSSPEVVQSADFFDLRNYLDERVARDANLRNLRRAG